MGVVHPTKLKRRLACILEADETTRLRMGNSIPHYHQDHIALEPANTPSNEEASGAKELRETATENVQCSKKIVYIRFRLGII